MKKITMRLIALALLTLVSMGAAAQTKINVQIANDGKFDGGTIEVTRREEQKDGGVKVTITVSPNSGYTIKKEAIKVYATYPPSGSRADTRDIEIASNLTLLYNGSEKEDVKDASAKRDYTFIVPSGFGAWVKEAKFLLDGSKGGSEPTRTIDPDNLSGVYYLGNGSGYNAENVANNFYLLPATNADYATGQPHLTTYKSGHVDNSCWYVIKNGAYYNIIHAADGKYLTANPAYDGTTDNNVGRLRVHLEAMDTPDNSTLFEIKPNKNGGYNIRHKDMADKINNSTTTYLDPAGGNRDGTDLTNYRTMDTSSGTVNIGGGIGYWTDEPAARWYFENALSIDSPTFTNNFDGTITITADGGAAIYYTTDGSTPTMSSSVYSTAITLTDDITVIKAIAKAASDPFPTLVTTYELPVCEKPVITVSGGIVTITCATDGSVIHYTTDESPATSSSPVYSEPFVKGSISTIRAVATSPGYIVSNEAALMPPTEVSSSSQITDMTGNYSLASNFSSDVSIGTSDHPFAGTIDGNMMTLSGLNHPFVAYANGAIIKNVILDNVSISGNDNGNAGAICGEATGDTRIYNCGVLATGSTVNTDKDGYTYLTDCSSSVSGSNYVGGIVGLLDGSARVINCFSYANVSGGNYAGGIVGYNKVATKSNNLKTMVMNCMFYGEVSGSSQAPIYNGSIITNRGDQSGVSNFNYFWAGASYVQNSEIDVYNCALSAETRFLQRFEFFRHMLNSNRELAAWWATGSMENKEEIMKWVLEPSQIGSSTPYPILKTPGKYPSVVNIDADHAEAFAVDAATKKTQYNQGRKFDTFTINIRNASSGSGSTAPSGANITTTSVTPNITDKDPAHFNFNYYKVQLPYYNDVGTKNYTGNKVVTGWKIVTISGGTHSFSTGEDATATADENGDITLTTPYNFADRKSTGKDKFDVSERVFSQGAYFDVPEGVTSITIEPYWGKCVYVSDEYPDVVYNQNMSTAYSVTTVGGGQRYTNGESYDINGNSQAVYTTMSAAVTALNPSGSVYDNAIVLVGNVHSLSLSNETKSKRYTIMSIDLDKDNEPDYSYILRFDSRKRVHPVRVDFLNVIGLGMAQKSNGGTGTYNFGIMQPYGWFECTNTGLFRVTQLEYDLYDSNTSTSAREESPMILQGGVIEQWVTVGGSEVRYQEAKSVTYYHVGGNVWFKEFHIGVHQDKTQNQFVSKHPPISVTGGDYDIFYLTGYYNSPNNNYDDNAECYINGGRFNKVAGTGMQGIGNLDTHANGNITWQIDNADINEFYGGGINAAHIAEGNIMTIISNSRVDQFCGGPKFGDMNSGRKVVTNATNCTFRTFFGAGYGGNSYNRRYPANKNNVQNIDWNSWIGEQYTKKYDVSYGGVETRIDYQFIPMSSNTSNVARLFVDYVSFSLATTRDVTSKLTDCTITKGTLGSLDLFSQSVGNFYGGGNLGMVDGPVKSTLTNCTVEGSAFGAGYSASMPPVAVMNNGFQTPPKYDSNLGAYLEAVMPSTETYTWQHRDVVNSTETANDKTNHILYTTADLTTLGAVTGTATLTINGTTTVLESVYGGGEESGVDGNTEVTVNSGTIGAEGRSGYGYRYGNVYGGGKGKIDNEGNLVVSSVADLDAGLVKGNTTVTINGTKETTKIVHNVYGGGAVGSVGTFTRDANGNPTACTSGGQATVTINGGQVGHNRKDSGMVNGSSRGWEGNPNGEGAFAFLNQLAWVNNGTVIIGDATTNDEDKGPVILGSVYGGGENGHNYSDGSVTINKGTIGNAASSAASYDCGNIYGAGCGTDTYTIGEAPTEHHNQKAGWVRGNTNITVNGGNILRNIYGAGSMGSVGNDTDAESGKTTVTINGGTIGSAEDSDHGHVFGGPKGDLAETEFKASVKSTLVNINAHPSDATKNPIVWGSVFGGGEAGIIKGSVAVNMNGGTVKKDVYGGGALADTQTGNWDATANENAGDWADAENKSALHTTTVRLKGGDILGEAYGGGLGEAGKPAYVWGDVLVDLNGTTSSGETGTAIAVDTKGCAVGQVFGCNNVNGTPKGDVMLHVYATQNAAATQIANASEVTTAKVKGRYDVTAVYGGGNMAAYNPVTPHDGTSGSKTKVIIEGCSLTSIETVYGGGNAAAVPETDVVIKSAYEIGYLFGGGNGKDDIAPGDPNPGADVGTLDHGTSTYGTGNANTLMEGGLIHEAYGGSNTKGIIKGSINQITDPKYPADPTCCELVVEKIVGAGKYADVDGDVNMTLSCQPERKVSLLFAGADEANVNGNIILNITNGHFGKVFGGNNLGGVVKGKITVNVEETGCQPIKIDDLYLGGNEAAYSVFGYYETEDPHPVTGKKILKPRTSATDPNLPVKLDGTSYTSIDQFTNYAQPELNIISCTYIGNVFGGGFGEGAVMYANPTVNVNMEAGAFADDIPDMMTELGLDVTKTAPNPDKLGIIRNVFGGGDAANIAGSTTVNIATESGKGAYIIGSVFGGGNAADVLGNTNVTMSGGYVFNGIFGGGYAGNVGTFNRSTAAANIYGHTTHTGCIGKPISCAEGTGKCTVVVDGGQIGPISVATEGMNRADADGGPVPEGWVWGGGQGLIEDPAKNPDAHFSSYVGSTDVTIGGTALIMESIIGGGEFGRVLGNTLVKIEGGQIGIGEGKVQGGKPVRYTDDQFVNPLTTTVTDANALAECSHYPYGKSTGTPQSPMVYLPYDPYCEAYPDYVAAHPELGPASTSYPSDGKTWIGCVFGGGSGYMPYLKKNDSGNPIGYDWCQSAGLVEGDTEVRISGGHILTNVYGGNEITDVKGKSVVKMTGGTIGVPRTLEQIAAHPLTCYLFGAGKGDERSRFYEFTNTGSVEVEISGGIIYGSVFGGSEDGHVTGDIKVDIKPGAIIGTWGTSYVDGNVFGGGRGFSGNTLTAGNVGGNVTLNISGGNILGSVYGGGRLASVGTYLVPLDHANYGKLIPDAGDDKHGHITINISGGTIGNEKEYIYNPTAEQKAAIPNTTFDYQNHLQYAKGGNVFTAGMGRLYALDGKTVLSSWQKLGQCKETTLNMTGGTVKSSVYGGGEIGIVAQNATLNIDGGTVGTKVVDSGDATKYYNFGSVFGGGKGSTDNIEGISAAGTTGGNVEVHLNKTVASDNTAKGAIVNQVFGCNDMNGSPKGTVTVHVYATQNADKANISTKPEKGTETFDVEAVYGGGNLAAYEPTDLTTGKTNVIIDGCGLTSIRQVYGGGNAASTPATNVVINGTYEVLELFGGGNGFDNLPDGRPNPGANVGYKNYTVYEKDETNKWVAKDDANYDTKEERTAEGSGIIYGTGQASVNVFGGTVHRVFGGSNTKGNVHQTAVTLMDENSGCEFCVDEAYGGGKSAPMDAEAKLLMACIPGLQAAYGGAEAAEIQGNVTLNITNGTFDRVFGGNNLSGTIKGSITVNIEEVGCKPVKIGELYGGGNQAGYSVYGYNDDDTPKQTGTKLYEDPQVNVMSFTSIGKVFGGGYGEGATLVGNPTVNVNEVYGRYYNDDVSVVGDNAKTPGNYPIPSHAKGKMGAISEIFGGGNAAKVIGNTTVNIATSSDVYIVKEVTAGAALPEGCYTRSGAGTTASPFVYTAATGNASADVTYYEKKEVLGVDIRGNVYGGGNEADVTGSTNVVVGKQAN